ncbi:hypothetical protein ACFQ9X_06220 [Catenulispora yoronensis]
MALLAAGSAGREVKATSAPGWPARKSSRADGSVRVVLSMTLTGLLPDRQAPTTHWVRARSSIGMPSLSTSVAAAVHAPGTGAKEIGITVR